MNTAWIRRYAPGLCGLVFAVTLGAATVTGSAGPLDLQTLLVVLTALVAVSALLALALVDRTAPSSTTRAAPVVLEPPPRPPRPDHGAPTAPSSPADRSGVRPSTPGSRPHTAAPERPPARTAPAATSSHPRTTGLAPGVTRISRPDGYKTLNPCDPAPAEADRDEIVAQRWEEIRERWQAEHDAAPAPADPRLVDALRDVIPDWLADDEG